MVTNDVAAGVVGIVTVYAAVLVRCVGFVAGAFTAQYQLAVAEQSSCRRPSGARDRRLCFNVKGRDVFTLCFSKSLKRHNIAS